MLLLLLLFFRCCFGPQFTVRAQVFGCLIGAWGCDVVGGCGAIVLFVRVVWNNLWDSSVVTGMKMREWQFPN